MKYYAGIGARATPKPILEKMKRHAIKLANLGYGLRSGGAKGADSAFESGCIEAGGNMLIYLPKDGFNGKHVGGAYINAPSLSTYKRAYEIARSYQPNWRALSSYGKILMTRNVFEVLGKNLRSPVKCVMCWTPDGSVGFTTQDTGGTGQAIRIAYDKGIQIYNYFNEE